MASPFLFLILNSALISARESPVISRDTTAFVHASYQTPDYPFESGNDRDALSSDGFCGPCPDVRSGFETYRTQDGGCNNLRRPSMGRSGTPYIRALAKDPRFDDFQCRRRHGELPSARDVSLGFVTRDDADFDPDSSLYVMLWGQLIDHDLLITPLRSTITGDFLDCCHAKNSGHPDCCPVLSKEDDFFYGASHRPNCQSVIRSKLANPQCDPNRRTPDVENGNTAWIDASFLYGSTDERASLLRTFFGGRLKVLRDARGRHFPPRGDDGMEFGDRRGDSHLSLTMLQTVLLRLHNDLAGRLRRVNPRWDDEKLFQEARKIIGAITQHVTYSEFLPRVLGSGSNLILETVGGNRLYREFYNPGVDGSVSLEFAAVGFRLHSVVSSWYHLVGPNYEFKSRLLLRNIFRVPMQLLNGTLYDDLMRGVATQPLRRMNERYSSEMTEWMFNRPGQDFGFDILAITIQRGRDLGLRGYADYRQKCGLGRVRTWADLGPLIPERFVRRLRSLYRRVEDVDLDVGAFLEVRRPGEHVGPLMKCLIEDQFRRSRDGDRFFYTRPGLFNRRQLRAIKSAFLSDILCLAADNESEMALQRNVFRFAHRIREPVFSCRLHSDFDIEAWRSDS